MVVKLGLYNQKLLIQANSKVRKEIINYIKYNLTFKILISVFKKFSKW